MSALHFLELVFWVTDSNKQISVFSPWCTRWKLCSQKRPLKQKWAVNMTELQTSSLQEGLCVVLELNEHHSLIWVPALDVTLVRWYCIHWCQFQCRQHFPLRVFAVPFSCQKHTERFLTVENYLFHNCMLLHQKRESCSCVSSMYSRKVLCLE